MAARLRRAGVEPEVITAELRATHPVIVAPTVDRSVLGIMVDFAKAVPYYAGDVRTEQGLARLEDWLAETPCHAALTRDRVVVPNRKAPELLRAAWMRKSQLRTSSAHGVVH